jgi:ABC-type uncharacterized transport system permease subunit
MATGLEGTLRGVIRSAAPIVIAAQGELITERAGVINLALDGTIMLSAMTAHAVVRETGGLPQAVLAAMAVGAAVAFVVVFSSIALRLSQVAVGFILTILCADLAIFLGKPYFNRPGKEIPAAPIPLLKDMPFLGPVLFRHNVLIYFSMALVFLVWFYIYHTRPAASVSSQKLLSRGERRSTACATCTHWPVERWSGWRARVIRSRSGWAGKKT